MIVENTDVEGLESSQKDYLPFQFVDYFLMISIRFQR